MPEFTVLYGVFVFLQSHVHVSARSTLSKWQQFILVLMKLRLDLPVQDLAYRFGISTSTVSRIFLLWIDNIYTLLESTLVWPQREDLVESMPMEFRKHFGTKVISIIDCFEVFIDKPSNVLAKVQTYSSYKSHNTAKFLISITPQGTITYISKAWGGRVSDKHITQHCGYLDKLLPGDVILADRGFNISELVGSRGAEVKIPAFTKGKSQLFAYEVEQTRKIARVRIHVERVIGALRQKYSILHGPLPLDYLITKEDEGFATIDKITIVCCALFNMSDSIVPFE